MRHLHEAKLLKIVDETTVDLRVDLGFGVSTRVRLHLHGVGKSTEGEGNLEEASLGVNATDFIYDWFNGHESVMISTVLNNDDPADVCGYVFSDRKMNACLNDDIIDAKILPPKFL